MQNHSRRSRRSAKQRGELPPKKSFFERSLDAFCQLSDAAQIVLIIGVLLLLSWLIAHPLILVILVKALLGLITIRATLKAL